MSKDLHEYVFDETTKDKLSLFNDYLNEWLPVFLAREQVIWKTINIVDFFAGPGRDKKGYPGSPELIFSGLNNYSRYINNRSFTINILLNEYKKSKYDELKKLVEEKGKEFPKYNIQVENLDFKVAFEKWYGQLNKPDCVNLIFFDQNGIKHINEAVFNRVIALQHTDFLFFVSSAHARRFFEHDSMKQYLQLNRADVERTQYYHVHRMIHEHIKGWVPNGKEYYLGRFSLRKDNGNIYGLIFGSGHVFGMEKFLRSCWDMDPERGEANYDIDKERLMPGQGNLFTGEVERPKKLEDFETSLCTLIQERKLITDKDIYLFIITSGFLPKHSKPVFAKLERERVINKSKLNLTHKVCTRGAVINEIQYC